MQVTEKNSNTGTLKNSGGLGRSNDSNPENKVGEDLFLSHLTKNPDTADTLTAKEYTQSDSGNHDEWVFGDEATQFLSASGQGNKEEAGFPEDYDRLVQSRELRRRGDPYMDPMETGYLLDIRGQAQFDALMEKNKSLIVNEAEKYGLDPRALAGAMKWEYEENPKGWISDSFQIGPLGKLWDDPGLGFGSMHNSVVEKFFPKWDSENSAKARMYMDTAIPLMAAQIDAQATRFESGINTFLTNAGIDQQVSVRDNPVMLSWLYNTSENSVDNSVNKQTKHLTTQMAKNKPLSMSLNIYENRLGKSQIGMAPWLEKNIDHFNSYNSSQNLKNEGSLPIAFERN